MRHRVAAITVAALVFAAIAPTLSWLEFFGNPEALNVSTALEIHRTGNWLLPTLAGEPRIGKPPLTAWITAPAISSATLAEISHPDRSVRHRAFRYLAWQVRWGALLSACVTLYAIFELGAILIGARGGLIALLVACSTGLWLRYSRFATTDVQLCMWVTIANVGLALAIFERHWWRGFVIAGIASGLAFMSKGPVCLVQTILPAVVFLAWHRLLFGEQKVRTGSLLPAIGTGSVLALAIALPWFVAVAIREPTAMSMWLVEVTREGATGREPDKWYSYHSFFTYMAPWIGFFVAGLTLAFLRLRHLDSQRLVYAAMLLVCPIVVLTFFRDRQLRYLLPLVGPAAIVTAAAILECWKAGSHDRAARLLAALHWFTLAAMCIGFPLAASGLAKRYRQMDGGPWHSLNTGILFAFISAAVIALGIALQRRWRGALVVTTAICMLLTQTLFAWGYRSTIAGRSEMRPLADLIADRFPGAPAFSLRPDGMRARPDMSIYLNRTIRPIRSVDVIQPAEFPQIILTFQRRGMLPTTTPPGWEYLGKAPRIEDWWHAYVVPTKPR